MKNNTKPENNKLKMLFAMNSIRLLSPINCNLRNKKTDKIPKAKTIAIVNKVSPNIAAFILVISIFLFKQLIDIFPL